MCISSALQRMTGCCAAMSRHGLSPQVEFHSQVFHRANPLLRHALFGQPTASFSRFLCKSLCKAQDLADSTRNLFLQFQEKQLFVCHLAGFCMCTQVLLPARGSQSRSPTISRHHEPLGLPLCILLPTFSNCL